LNGKNFDNECNYRTERADAKIQEVIDIVTKAIQPKISAPQENTVPF
jgi:hypothetical protein